MADPKNRLQPLWPDSDLVVEEAREVGRLHGGEPCKIADAYRLSESGRYQIDYDPQSRVALRQSALLAGWEWAVIRWINRNKIRRPLNLDLVLQHQTIIDAFRYGVNGG